MALTPEILFVNPDYIKRITNINGSIEDAYLVPSIILAQDKYIQLYLGTDLLNKLKADISGYALRRLRRPHGFLRPQGYPLVGYGRNDPFALREDG